MRDRACLASRAAAANNREYVERTEHTSELEWTHNTLAVGWCGKELV